MNFESSFGLVSSIWVFGYGSLTWKPDIQYKSKLIGCITGFQRRFYQGSVTHRGSIDNPGRVGTLVPDETSVVWGVAYELVGKEEILKALKNLNARESRLGGYDTVATEFYPRNNTVEPFNVILYTASPDNNLYLGEDTIENMAEQIANTEGFAGPNSDYITRLAEYTREYIPEDKDEHLFELDLKVRRHLKTRTPSTSDYDIDVNSVSYGSFRTKQQEFVDHVPA